MTYSDCISVHMCSASRLELRTDVTVAFKHQNYVLMAVLLTAFYPVHEVHYNSPHVYNRMSIFAADDIVDFPLAFIQNFD
jgi:hypothetical protein